MYLVVCSNDIVLDSHSAEPIHAMIEVHETEGACLPILVLFVNR